MVAGPGAPQSHLSSQHTPLPANMQTTDKGRAAAEAHSKSADGPLTITSTLPLINSPHRIPRLGFGIYQSPPAVCTQSCLTALKEGYRHIDSAQFYQNEKEMGVAARESGVARSELFLTTKILSPAGSVEKTYEKCRDSVQKVVGEFAGSSSSVKKEDEYVDLFLIHTANGGAAARKEMWLALERLHKEGLARHIGVSNFGAGHIAELKQYASVWPPAVNQIELHPWCQQRVAVDYCHEHKIVVEAYSPLVRNLKAHDKTLVAVAERSGHTTTQVLVRWSLQKGWVTLPKSDNPERIKANADVFGWELSAEDMKTLDDLDQGDEGAIVQAVKND